MDHHYYRSQSCQPYHHTDQVVLLVHPGMDQKKDCDQLKRQGAHQNHQLERNGMRFLEENVRDSGRQNIFVSGLEFLQHFLLHHRRHFERCTKTLKGKDKVSE